MECLARQLYLPVDPDFDNSPAFTKLYYISPGDSTHLPSLISTVSALDTTSLLAKSFKEGAYLSINLSPSLLIKNPPSPRLPSVIKHPAPYIPACT